MQSCYDYDLRIYSNSKCVNPAESCSKWKIDGKWIEGCLREEYCGQRGNYEAKGEALYLCPDKTDTRGESPLKVFKRAEDYAEYVKDQAL